MNINAETESTAPALLSQDDGPAQVPKSGKADLIFKLIACAIICVLLYKLLVP